MCQSHATYMYLTDSDRSKFNTCIVISFLHGHSIDIADCLTEMCGYALTVGYMVYRPQTSVYVIACISCSIHVHVHVHGEIRGMSSQSD